MTRFRNTYLHFFIQWQITRTTLRKKNIGHSLLNKDSKFQKFNKIYCGMTSFRNAQLGVFRQYQKSKTVSKKKYMGQNRFHKLSKFLKFQLSNLTLTWSNAGKMNRVLLDKVSLFKRITKHENVGQNHRKKHLNYIILVKYCVMAIFRNCDHFLMGTESNLLQKGIIKVYEIITIQL